MIHYHGSPITPETAAARVYSGGHGFVSFRHRQQMGLVLDVCQSFAVDNGAFSAWTAGTPTADWLPYYDWVAGIRRYPGFDFAVIPDVIDGDEAANDALLAEWPWGKSTTGAPVWHMHESIDRLVRLAHTWPRVCLGSSGEFRKVGSPGWHSRMHAAMMAITDTEGFPVCKLHGLRMLNPAIFSTLPLASADSTNIARNVGIDQRWKGTYSPPTKDSRAALMRERIEATPGAKNYLPRVPAAVYQA